MYEILKFLVVGSAPILMHNGRLSDPLDPATKALAEVTKKRGKTDADHEECARREFLGGLYMSEAGPVIPASVIESTLVNAAKKKKLGVQAKAGLLVEKDAALEYDGPRTADELWADGRFRFSTSARVQNKRVVRTRPMFYPWKAILEVEYLPDQLNRGEVIEMVSIAGRVVGFCDWRPRFGRFTAEVA